MKHGTSRRQRIAFSPSKHLQHLRVARRQTVEQHLRKDLSLQIRQIHRQELKRWKSNQLNAFLGNPSRSKDLRDYLPRPSGRRGVIYPHLDDIASMLEALFVGPSQPLQRPMRLTEPGWDLLELRFAVQRLKTGKCGDELGLTAELLKHAPENFLSTLLTLYNNALVSGERPESWCKKLFSSTTCEPQTYCKDSFIIHNICIIFYLEDWNSYWKQDSRKNSMDFGQDDD